MNRNLIFILGALIMALVIATFTVGKAIASTGCFSDTNSHWAETYICWLKDNGIASGYPDGTFKPGNPITRAEVAVVLKAANAVPPQSGQILFSAGNSNWKPVFPSDNVQQTNTASFTRLTKGTAGLVYYTVQPDFTPVLYGKSLELLGVEFCFNADLYAYLTYVELDNHKSSNGSGTAISFYVSNADFVGQSCHYFTLTTPVLFAAEDSVSFFIGVEWVAGGPNFDIGRTTFVFQPTATTAVPPASISGEAVVLQEGTGVSPVSLP